MRTNLGQLSVAVIHDWLNGMRGGEQVLDAILELFPQAELFTLFHEPGRLNNRIESRPIHVSFLNKIPFSRRYYKYLLPCFPLAIESFDLSSFDVIISSSHCVAKGVIPSPSSLHICYCHTPMRYAWDKRKDYFRSFLAQTLTAPFLHYLRMWDTISSSRVDYFISNSKWVQSRIQKYYRRHSHVIYPFVNRRYFQTHNPSRKDYYLVVSALVPYKKISLAVEACEKLGKKLLIVGTGPEESQLRKKVRSHTEFLGKVSWEELQRLYAEAKALLFPGEEDFGITPLEAMASGTPVIAFKRGGVTESVVSGQTGIFFEEQTIESLTKAIQEFESSDQVWGTSCVERARLFERDSFLSAFGRFVESALDQAKYKKTSEQTETSL